MGAKVTTEHTFQSYLLAALNAAGRPTRFWRQNAGKFQVAPDRWIEGAPKGAGDLIGLCAPDGLMVEVECKGARTPTTDEQRRRGAMLRMFGGCYIEVRVDPGLDLATNVGRAVERIDLAIEDCRAERV